MWAKNFNILSLSPFMFCTGSDAILLGAETLRGLYPVETISIVGKICAEVYLPVFYKIIFSHVILFG